MVVHWEYLKELMKIRGWSCTKLSEECGTPKSTLQKLLSGETEDPRLSSFYPPVKALGASLDRMLELAPPRDFEAEKRCYDATLMQTMQDRNNMQQAKIDEYTETISSLKSQLAADQEHIKSLNAIIENKNIAISEQKAYIKRIHIVIAVLSALLVCVCTFCIWEFCNFSAGLTGHMLEMHIEDASAQNK